MSAFWLAVIVAAIWGFVPLLEKIGLSNISPITGLFYRSLGVVIGLVLLLLFFIRPQEIRSADLKSAVLIMTGGFLASFAAMLIYYFALKAGEMSMVIPVSASYPLIAFLLGVTVLGESFSFLKLMGAILIIIGLWMLKVG